MTTIKKIERKGYKVTVYASGNGCEAVKISKETGAKIGYPIRAKNVTQLLKSLAG